MIIKVILRVLLAWMAGFKHMIFDDNYELGNFIEDSLSMKVACDILKNRINPFQKGVLFRDDFDRIKRNFHPGDVHKISRVLESVVDTYYEFPYPFKTDAISNVLFPQYDWDYFKQKFKLKHDPDHIYKEMGPVGEYFYICYVKLY